MSIIFFQIPSKNFNFKFFYFPILRWQDEKIHLSFSLIKALDNGYFFIFEEYKWFLLFYNDEKTDPSNDESVLYFFSIPLNIKQKIYYSAVAMLRIIFFIISISSFLPIAIRIWLDNFPLG